MIGKGRFAPRLIVGIVALSVTLAVSAPLAQAKKDLNSPLTEQQQRLVTQAARNMKSGKHKLAEAQISELLETVNDVPKCLAIAAATESYGHPMNESRRNCMIRAYKLCASREDMILVALKARTYQFYEITRNAINTLVQNAKSVPELYDLATKSQEVALNDVAHLALEKAYTGVKDQNSAYAFAEQSKALGMDDLLRKVLKDLVDDEEDVSSLCDLVLKINGYNLRDMNRYAFRKALDKASTVEEMTYIFEVARRLNEPDIANRAQYFMRKGKIIQKIKEDRAGHEAHLRSWREGAEIDATSAAPDPGSAGIDGKFSGPRKPSAPVSGF